MIRFLGIAIPWIIMLSSLPIRSYAGDPECHCLDEDVLCDPLTGACASGDCDHGWKGRPYCQTECDGYHFGVNCQDECHCPAYDVCNPVDGLCSSGACRDGWTGPACSIENPRLSRPPEVTPVSLSGKCFFSVEWPAWGPATGVGDGPIAAYTLEMEVGGHPWEVVKSSPDVEGQARYTYYHTVLSESAASRGDLAPTYSFRVVLDRLADGKAVTSVPGPASTPRTPCDLEAPVTAARTVSPRAGPLPMDTTAGAQQPTHDPLQPYTKSADTTTQSSIQDSHSRTTAYIKYSPTALRLVFGPDFLEADSGDDIYLVFTPQRTYDLSYVPMTMTHHIRQDALATPVNLDQLHLETLYKVTLHRAMPNGTHSETALWEHDFWTPPEKPPLPKPPKVMEVTNQSISILVNPVEEKGQGLFWSYEIIVEEMRKTSLNLTRFDSVRQDLEYEVDTDIGTDPGAVRQTRNVPRSVHTPYNASDFYITAELSANISCNTTFVIGSSRYSGGPYENYPLNPNTLYMVWFAAKTSLGQVTRRTFVGLEQPVVTGTPSRLVPMSLVAVGQPTIIAAAMSTGLVFLLAVIAVLLFLYFRSRRDRLFVFEDIATYHHGATLADKHIGERNSNNNSLTHSAMYQSCDPIDVLSSGPEIRVPQGQSADGYYVIKKSRPIPVKEMRHYCLLHDKLDYTLAEEFRHLPAKFVDAVHVAKEPQNAILNRSMEVIPYDRNRVKLSRGASQRDRTYINASFVQSLDRSSYIATQAPLSVTAPDFWRLVWEQEVGAVVMLMDTHERGKPLCERYWPQLGASRDFSNIRVSLVNEERAAHYYIRDLKVTCVDTGAAREVTQYQFVSWTRGGLPVHPIPYVDFVRRIQEERDRNQATVAHCHAGGGRTGVYIAVDSLLQHGRQTGKVDVLQCTTLLRLERPNLVKTFKQYRFVHEALAEAFDHPESRISGERFPFAFDNLLNVRTPQRISILAQEYEDLRMRRLHNQKKWPDSGTFSDVSVFHSPKKRPGDKGADASLVLPTLAEQRELDQSDADVSEILTNGAPAFLDTFHVRDQVIVAQYPGVEQREDFWRLVRDNGVACIVDISAEGIPTCLPLYCPAPDSPVLDRKYRITVDSHVSNDPFNSCVTREVRLIPVGQRDEGGSAGGEAAAAVRVLEWHGWPADRVVPAVQPTLDVVRALQTWYRGHLAPGRRVLVLGCQVGRAALFTMLWTQCQRLQEEWLVDLYSVVKYTQSAVPRAVSNLDQYRLLYKAMKEEVHSMRQSAPCPSGPPLSSHTPPEGVTRGRTVSRVSSRLSRRTSFLGGQ